MPRNSRLKFSLLSITILALFISAVFLLGTNFEPWRFDQVFHLPGKIYSAIRFSPSGEKLCAIAKDGTVVLWEVKTGRLLLREQIKSEYPLGVTYHLGQLRLYSGDNGNEIIIRDDKMEIVSRLKGHICKVTSFVSSRNDSIIVTGDEEGNCFVWSQEGLLEKRIQTSRVPIFGVDISKDDSLLLLVLFDGEILVHSKNGDREIVFNSPVGIAWDGKFVAGSGILTCHEDGILRHWDVNMPKKVLSTISLEGRVRAFEVGNDGRIVAVGQDGVLRIWTDLGSGCAQEVSGRSGCGFGIRLDYNETTALIATSTDCGDVVLLKRRRPEYWWGLAWLPEFWLTVVFGIALIWSLRRDWKTLRGKKVEAKAEKGNGGVLDSAAQVRK